MRNGAAASTAERPAVRSELRTPYSALKARLWVGTAFSPGRRAPSLRHCVTTALVLFRIAFSASKARESQ